MSKYYTLNNTAGMVELWEDDEIALELPGQDLPEIIETLQQALEAYRKWNEPKVEDTRSEQEKQLAELLERVRQLEETVVKQPTTPYRPSPPFAPPHPYDLDPYSPPRYPGGYWWQNPVTYQPDTGSISATFPTPRRDDE